MVIVLMSMWGYCVRNWKTAPVQSLKSPVTSCQQANNQKSEKNDGHFDCNIDLTKDQIEGIELLSKHKEILKKALSKRDLSTSEV